MIGAPENIVLAVAGVPSGAVRDTLLTALGYNSDLSPASEVDRIRATKQLDALLDDEDSEQGEIGFD